MTYDVTYTATDLSGYVEATVEEGQPRQAPQRLTLMD